MKTKWIFALFIFALSTAVFKANVKAEWIDPSGTARGFSSNFYYTIDSSWNKGVTQQGPYDELIAAGAEYRLYSDGQVWTSLGYDSIINVTNGAGNANPVIKVEMADPSIAQFSFYGEHNSVTFGQYYIKALKYGTTSLFIQRKSGDSFTIPINIVPRTIINNDDKTISKDIILGLGQSIKPEIQIINASDLLTNSPRYEKWTSSNSDVIEVSDGRMLTAKNVGTAVVECVYYDTLTCMNKYHYNDYWDGRKVTYSIRVQQEIPVIQIKNEANEILNQKIIEKEVGQTFKIIPELEGLGTVLWKFKSSDNSVATVNQSGVITAKKKGTVQITVKGAEQTSQFTVNVIPAKIPETTTKKPEDTNTTPATETTTAPTTNTPKSKVVLKRPKIKKVKKRSSFYVLMIKGQKYNKYEVYYGSNKKCKKRIGIGKSKKLAFSLKLKKQKTYYFKIRGIKYVNKKKYKSKFSKIYKYRRSK